MQNKPMTVMEALNNRVPQYTVDRCAPKQACNLNLAGIRRHQRTIVDCDKYISHNNPEHNMCDYIVACELGNESVSVVEMKSRGARASQIKEQLQQGARLAENWIGNTSVDKFMPILLSKGGIGKELRVLAKHKITFQGSDHDIKKRRCGLVLRDLL